MKTLLNRFKINLYAQALFLILFLFLTPFKVHATGISPAVVTVDKILPGQEVVRYITASLGKPSNGDQVMILIDKKIAPYIRSRDGKIVELKNNSYGKYGEIITVPDGQWSVDYYFIVHPGTLPAGTYEGAIRVYPVVKSDGGDSIGGGGAGSRLISGAQGKIQFIVSNETLESYSIEGVNVRNTEQSTPVSFSYVVQNSGNVDSGPRKIEITVKNKLGAEELHTETLESSLLELTSPFTSKEYELDTKMLLSPGPYAINFVFYDEKDQIKYAVTNQGFDVFPDGFLSKSGELVSLTTDKTVYEPGELIKITGAFKNTGPLSVKASFTSELSLDNKRFDILKKDPLLVPAGRSVEMEQLFRAVQTGAYKVVGYVTFDLHETVKKEAEFRVKGQNVIAIVAFIVVATLLLGGGTWWWYKRRRNA